ncbi:MAG: putative lipid II flippase FtsW [Clostridia bacterium]|nr:putative lipid II flippase FtsW [Clostridia bacterium]
MPQKRRGNIDLGLLLTVGALLSIGLVMVFSSSAYSARWEFNDSFYYLKRQLVWALMGLVVMFWLANVNYYRIQRLSIPILAMTILLLVLVLVPGVGLSIKGASRWLGFGPLRFQPSELAKPAMVIFSAWYLTNYQEQLRSFVKGMAPFLLVLGLICGLVLAQPDLGTAVAIAGTMYFMLFLAGARSGHLTLLALLGIAVGMAAIITAPYRLERLTAFLNPHADPSDTGWQTLQSLLALGSGSFFGAGLGGGIGVAFYVPERHTDFIFAILGEQLGFLGAMLIIGLFAVLAWRGFRIAINAPNHFASLLAAGVTTMVLLQAVINIGVVSGTLPVTGITLPFLSYGGSSLLFTLAGMGMLLNISRFAIKH